MSINQDFSDQKEFRLVLILSWMQVVLAEHHGYRRQLPRINIPKGIRAAHWLGDAFHQLWGARAVVIDFLPKSSDLPPCAVLEIRTPQWRFMLDGFIPVDVDDLVDAQELTWTECLILQKIIAGDTQDRGPFSKLKWLEEAQEWIRASVDGRRIEFNDDVRQFNACGQFALVRFETFNGPAYWLKATGAPNAHELSITQAVSRYCPNFVPPLIATRADWNAWVTEEAGQPLHDTCSLHAFQEATRSLAEMQIVSASHIKDLLACGCFDQRMPVLRRTLPNLIHYLDAAMANQNSTKVFPLNRARLTVIGKLLQEATLVMGGHRHPRHSHS
jgi:hypothetical protein